MKLATIVAICAFSVGCKSLQRLPGLEPAQAAPPEQAPQDPNNFYATGTTSKDHESVYLPTKDHTVTVEVQRPGESAYTLLAGNDAGYFHQYRAFIVPREGVYFENVDGGWGTGEPVAPTGTHYKIHSVKK